MGKAGPIRRRQLQARLERLVRSGALPLVASAAIILPLNLAGGVLTARLLGPADRGLLTSLSVWTVVLALAATAGTLEGVLAFAGRYQDDPHVGDAVVLLLARTGLLAIAALVVLPVVVVAARGHRVLAALVVAMAALLALLQTLLVLRERLWQAGVARVLQPGLFVVLLAFFSPGSFSRAFGCFAMSQAGAVLLSGFLLGRARGRLRVALPRLEFRRYVRSAQITPAAALISSRADLLVFGAVLRPADFGNYAIAASVASVVTILLASVMPLVLSRAAQGRLPARRVGLAVCGSAAALAVLLCGLAYPVLPLVYGGGFGRAPFLLALLAPGVVASSLSAYCTAVLQGRGLPAAANPAQVTTALLLPVVLWAAAHLGGATAGALAWSACGAVLATVLARRVRQESQRAAQSIAE